MTLTSRPVRAVRLAVLTAVALLLVATGCSDEPDQTTTATTATTPAPSTASASPSSSPHAHHMHEVPDGQAPSVRMELTPDSADGWNVHLLVDRFTFAPERVGGQVQPGEGHAHLYLDGTKIARVYGPWYHLPSAVVGPGTHTLTAELNANDHGAWAVSGTPVSASTQLTGTAPTTGGTDQGAATPAGDADVTVTISIVGDTVSPSPGRVEVSTGQTVRIEIASDSADTVHVHGYDLEAPVGPDAPATISFVADRSGLFEVETHESEALLTQLLVR